MFCGITNLPCLELRVKHIKESLQFYDISPHLTPYIVWHKLSYYRVP